MVLVDISEILEMKTQLDFIKVYNWRNVTYYPHPYHVLKLGFDCGELGALSTERYYSTGQYIAFLNFVPKRGISDMPNGLFETDHEVCYTAKKGKLENR